MIIIGGSNSSNTHKLYEVCKVYCSNTIKIESADEIDEKMFRKLNRIGITAGASTPYRIIKEVLGKMNEIMKPDNEKEFFRVI